MGLRSWDFISLSPRWARRELVRLAPDVLLRTLLIVSVSEFLVMVLLDWLSLPHGLQTALLDVTLLAAFSLPPLYWLVFRRIADVAAGAASALAEARFRTAMEAVTESVVVVDSEGFIVYTNPAVQAMFGYTPQEVVGHPLSLLLPFRSTAPGHPQPTAPPLLLEGSRADVEGCRADGQRFPVVLSTGRFVLGPERFSVVVVRDISRQREAERELIRLAAFPELNPNPVLECDAEGRLTYANPVARRLLHRLWGGKAASDVLPTDLPRLVRRCLDEPGGLTRREVAVGAQTFLWSLHPVPGRGRVHIYATDLTERKQMEMELRSSEERYRALAETAHDAIFVINRDDTIEYVNSFGARQLGRRPEQVIGRRSTELFPPEVASLQKENLDRVFAHRQPVYAEEKTPFPGKELWLSTWLVPLRNEAGDVTGVMGISRDITAHKDAEEQLRKFSAAVEQTADPVLITKLDGTIEYVNSSFAKVTGYTAEEAVGRNPGLLNSGTHPREFYKELWQTILAGRTWRGVFVNRRKDNTTYYADTSITPIRSPLGTITHFVSVEKDISRQKELEMELHRSAEHFRRLVEQLPIATRVVQEGGIAFSNSADAALFGYTEAVEILGADPMLFVAEEDAVRLRQYLLARSAGQPAPTRYECRLRRRDGSVFPAALCVARILYEGRPASLVVVLDLTEKKRLRLFESLIPACCVCGKVRDDNAPPVRRWRTLDEYVVEHSDADLSHTFCPACYHHYRKEQGLPPDDYPG